MSVYQSDNFKGRVTFAAGVISSGGRTSRSFDTCFEMNDGAAVAAALVRRARARPDTKLAANLFRYVCEKSATESHDKLAGADLETVAAELREAAESRWRETLAAQDARNATAVAA